MSIPLRTDLDAILTATDARRCGSGWRGRTVCHGGNDRNLAIILGRNGKPIFKCFSRDCSYPQIVAALGECGIKIGGLRISLARRKDRNPGPNRQLKPSPNRIAAAAIWNTTTSAVDTLAQVYLTSRGLHIPLPGDLRFHPALGHPSGDLWPVMVALIRDGVDSEAIAIHRTFLARDGRSKAPVEPAKMALGPCGGGAVQLAPAYDTLLVGEGIETTLSAMQATGFPGWATLGTSGMRALHLPEFVREVVILADADDAGEKAASDAAARWVREGRCVRIARPPKGTDFNDILVNGIPQVEVRPS